MRCNHDVQALCRTCGIEGLEAELRGFVRWRVGGLIGDFLSGPDDQWATDVALHTVVKLDASTGKVVLRLGTKGRAGRGPHHFNKPTDVAVDPKTERVYVSDGYGNSRIVVYSYTGTYLSEWGSFGTHPGQFIIPHSVSIDAARDRLYVADRENGRVQARDVSFVPHS